MDPTYFQHSRSEMLRYLPPRAHRILDVGCAEGNFGALLKARAGCHVWGIEPNRSAADIARNNVDVIINGPFDETAPLGEQRFDCIFFNDVLEHLVDPWAALTLAAKHLAPDGVVISSIPNVRFFFCILEILVTKDWKYRNAGILDKTHLRFFTKKSIGRLFEECNYQVKLIEGLSPTNHKYFALANLLLCGHIDDMRYEQFAVVAGMARG